MKIEKYYGAAFEIAENFKTFWTKSEKIAAGVLAALAECYPGEVVKVEHYKDGDIEIYSI